MEKGIFTVERLYSQSEILDGAYDDYQQVEKKYNELKASVESGRFSNCLGVCVLSWKNGKATIIKEWYKNETHKG